MTISEAISTLGVKALLLDLDGTLMSTHPIFIQQQTKVVNLLVEARPEWTWDQVNDAFNGAKRDAVTHHSVVPELIWPHVMSNLLQMFELDSGFIELGCEIMMQTYQIVPQVYSEVPGYLAEAKEAGALIGVVTHADGPWTEFKLEATELMPFVDHVELAPIDQPKTSESWLRGANALGVPPRFCLGAGDNINGDILAAIEVGVAHNILVRREDAWKHVNDGNVPEGVVVCADLRQGTKQLAEAVEYERALRRLR